jgi:hypothetical protein
MIESFETLTIGSIDSSIIALITAKPTHWFGCFFIQEELPRTMRIGGIGMRKMTMMMRTTVIGTMVRISLQVPVSRIVLVKAEEKDVPLRELGLWHHGAVSGIAQTIIGVQRSGPFVCLVK